MWRRIWRGIERTVRRIGSEYERAMRDSFTFTGDALTGGALSAKEQAEADREAAEKAAKEEQARLDAAQAQQDAEAEYQDQISNAQSGISAGQANTGAVSASGLADGLDEFTSSLSADDEDEEDRIRKAFGGR